MKKKITPFHPNRIMSEQEGRRHRRRIRRAFPRSTGPKQSPRLDR